jgi:hypothetical protein
MLAHLYLLFWLGQYGSLATGFDGTLSNPSNIASALYSGLWAFDGWYVLCYP